MRKIIALTAVAAAALALSGCKKEEAAAPAAEATEAAATTEADASAAPAADASADPSGHTDNNAPH